jgi:predicted acylesterase/phospholipase RssA/CRP-like cAMP-binding protein
VSSPDALAEVLANAAPFRALPRDVMVEFATQCTTRFVQGGDIVVREEDEPDQAFVVVSGRVRVLVTGAQGPFQIAELGPGELFGEMALLAPGGRRATVVAARDTELLCLGAEQFRSLVGHPDAFLAVARLLVERATSRLAPVSTPPRAIAVGAVGHPRAHDEVVASLASALAAHGPTITVGASEVEAHLGRDAAEVGVEAAGELLAFLDRIERAHRFVVYRMDPAHPRWSERCLRQADRIVLAADASDRTPLVAMALPPGTRCDVLILHDAWERTPALTPELVDALPVDRHFHVRRHDDGDAQRVARQVAGEAVGVVLGGGGARGFAHLGVIHALETAGVPVDAVGGTSVGALMGALVAWGFDHPTRVERAKRFVAGRLTLPTLPILSATSARRLTERLRRDELAGTRDLFDAWLPFFCVSTNLSTARPFVHRRGPAWQALRASISLPGMMPPVCTEQGELLVDGGLVDDLPVDVMTPLLDGGRLVAVDLGISSDFRVTQRFDPSLSGWRVLARRLKPFGPRFDAPNLLTTLLRAKEVASSESLDLKRTAHEVTLLVRPPVSGFGGFDFRDVDTLMERSYRHTLEQLAEDPAADELTRSPSLLTAPTAASRSSRS